MASSTGTGYRHECHCPWWHTAACSKAVRTLAAENMGEEYLFANFPEDPFIAQTGHFPTLACKG